MDTQNLAGYKYLPNTGKKFNGFNPATGTALEPVYRYGDESHVEAACVAAAAAFVAFRGISAQRRAQFLEAVADNIEALSGVLVPRAVAESGLPEGRIAGEVGRTTGQLRLFADVLREGGWAGARIDGCIRSQRHGCERACLTGVETLRRVCRKLGFDLAAAS